MTVQFLFNSKGDWVAFRKERFVYNTDGKWIGWLPWDESDVVTVKGEYLGTIEGSNRFYHYKRRPPRSHPGTPRYPGYPGVPKYPGFAGMAQMPAEASDVAIPAGE